MGRREGEEVEEDSLATLESSLPLSLPLSPSLSFRSGESIDVDVSDFIIVVRKEIEENRGRANEAGTREPQF